MKLKNTVALIALAAIGAGASAATTTDWGPLGPTADVAYVTYHTAGTIDDVYSFSLTAISDVAAYGSEFEARSVTLPDATFTLFSGTFGSATATQVEGVYSFTNAGFDKTYASLGVGDYFFEVTGTAGKSGAAYDFEAGANEPGGPSDVPEPASVALMLAGLGMMGFMGRRRRN